uniref:Uncharacterized protein n=1 Tax=Strongyloides papillosus TaxID=174720 RepID=A0A0N5CHT4_STREA
MLLCVIKTFVYSRNIYHHQYVSPYKGQYYKYPSFNNNQQYYYNQNSYNNQNYHKQQYYYQQYNNYQQYPTTNQQYYNYYSPALANTKGLNFRPGYVPFHQMKIGEAYGDALSQYWIICHTCPKG